MKIDRTVWDCLSTQTFIEKLFFSVTFVCGVIASFIDSRFVQAENIYFKVQF